MDAKRMTAREYLAAHGDNPETRAFRAAAEEEGIRRWAEGAVPTLEAQEGLVITDGVEGLIAAMTDD
jgi:hypothetical protein